MFPRDLRALLLASIGSASCSAQGGDVVVPPTPSASSPVISVVEPVASLQRPNKDPREAMWHASGADCMPSWATDQKNPHPQRTACGNEPGSWLHGGGGRHRWRQYELNVPLSASEGAKRGGDACCYTSYDDYPMEGRPLEGERGHVLAAPAGRSDWGAPLDGLPRDPVAAAAWLEAARFEHASIASFARLAEELLGLGAPAALVRGAQEAALDEVRHAREAFAIAGALSGAPVGPGPLPVGDARAMARSLVALAEASIRLGCVGESLAALEAWEASRAARPEIARALALVAADEARHAALAFRVAAWAGRAASAEERRALRSIARQAALAPPSVAPDRAARPALGRLGTEAAALVAAAGHRDVVAPALLALADALTERHGALDAARG